MSNPSVVSNTSPLIFLEKINSIYLLRDCFSRILIPHTVYMEWGIATLPDYIKVQSLSELSKSYVEGAIGRLHRGEIEVIRLAIDNSFKYVLMDDILARRYAERHGLIPIGTLGIMKIA